MALVRPREPRFSWRRKTAAEVQEDRDAFQRAARQTSLFDKELAAIEPTPYEFKFKFRDAEADHTYTNGDWEAHAMFYNGLRSGKSEAEVLDWMNDTFNVKYPRAGMVFAVGNQAKRPQVWQLLGVLRLDETPQAELF
ncbi:MAG TPA: hypothetical protein VGN97_12200 [Mesorhizobium sp.]|nr:hypothetical protein [Mesorhizobium sp.]